MGLLPGSADKGPEASKLTLPTRWALSLQEAWSLED